MVDCRDLGLILSGDRDDGGTNLLLMADMFAERQSLLIESIIG